MNYIYIKFCYKPSMSFGDRTRARSSPVSTFRSWMTSSAMTIPAPWYASGSFVLTLWTTPGTTPGTTSGSTSSTGSASRTHPAAPRSLVITPRPTSGTTPRNCPASRSFPALAPPATISRTASGSSSSLASRFLHNPLWIWHRYHICKGDLFSWFALSIRRSRDWSNGQSCKKTKVECGWSFHFACAGGLRAF
jgi:hypothetical protein